MSHVTTVEPSDLFFEDFTEGQEFPTVTKGPMMVGHQVRWAGACDNYDSEFHHVVQERRFTNQLGQLAAVCAPR